LAGVSFQKLWDNHPGIPSYPCDQKTFENQCAIRMGVAFHGAGINMDSFKGASCWIAGHKGKGHILRAQEFANWLKMFLGKPQTFKKKDKTVDKNLKNKKGIVFIQDGWGATDHIDLWNGSQLKGGYLNYFLVNWKALWFWELT